MNEERLRNEEFETGPSPFTDAIGTPSDGGGGVNVVSGIYAHSFPLVGMTVGQARRELEERLNIDPEAQPIVDGHAADDDTLLREGQVLTFLTASGEKGLPVVFAAA